MMRTLKILLACAALGVSFALLFPLSHPHRAAPLTAMLNNGRGIYMLIGDAQQMAEETNGMSVWPPSQQVFTSTDYFRSHASDIFRDVTFSFFTGPNLAIASNAHDFLPHCNAWSLNAIPLATNGVGKPMIFTRNLHFKAVNGAVRCALTDEQPFGLYGAAIVLSDGHCLKVFQSDPNFHSTLASLVTHLTPDDVSRILTP